jgi:hypothetical protein
MVEVGDQLLRHATTCMNNLVALILAISLLLPDFACAQDWRMQPLSISTRWAASVSPKNAWPEYPRPQMVRANWVNLNGLWQYAITPRGGAQPEKYDGSILVPYPLESALSGVAGHLNADQWLWYRRQFSLSPARAGERALLHFDAVDYEATVFLNGTRLGKHSGGYQRFTFDVTEALKTGQNELVVQVYDPSDKGLNPRGKQSLNAQWKLYTPSSGIWQTVWIERVPASYIGALRMTPDVDHGALNLEVAAHGLDAGDTIEAIARTGNKVVARRTVQGRTALSLSRPRLWSPDDPYLYDLEVRLLRHGRLVDSVKSYFGLRKIEVRQDAQGTPRVFLNNHYTYNLGVVDQGFWPDGLYAAARDAALKFDVQAIKALGFNSVRKHIKLEPERWYTYCDRLGLMVWQDMPSGGNDTPEGRAEFDKETKENLTLLHNHPSITVWVPFNEGWGAYDQERLAREIKQADPSRLVDGHSGPYNQVEFAQYFKRMDAPHLERLLSGDRSQVLEDIQATQFHAEWWPGDLADFHYYPGPKMPPVQPGVASVTGETGSFGAFIDGHVWNDLGPIGRGNGAQHLSPKELLERYADSIEKLKALESQGLSGSMYFEMFDVEDEEQGFLTYDREVTKVPIEAVASLNARLVPQAKNYASAIEGFSARSADSTPESQRYQALVTQYRGGQRDLPFLRRLALMALRQGDEAQATAAAGAYIDASPRPYSREAWSFIAAVTRTSKDKGFDLLRKKTREADAALGPQAAEKKLVAIMRREVVGPRLKDPKAVFDRTVLEASAVAEYGELGQEAVEGARMMDAWSREDWATFGQSYVRYFKAALPRSAYPLHNLSYQVLEHVSDAHVLETALDVVKFSIDSDKPDSVFGRYDPTELDTYAGLLYKLGRNREALEWEAEAAVVSDGRDPEIVKHLQKMRSGAPTSPVP